MGGKKVFSNPWSHTAPSLTSMMARSWVLNACPDVRSKKVRCMLLLTIEYMSKTPLFRVKFSTKVTPLPRRKNNIPPWASYAYWYEGYLYILVYCHKGYLYILVYCDTGQLYRLVYCHKDYLYLLLCSYTGKLCILLYCHEGYLNIPINCYTGHLSILVYYHEGYL